MQVPPDILRYDRTKPATYPNGRVLTDDVFSMRFAWLSHGKVPPTGLPNQAAPRSRPGRAGRRPHGAPGPPP
jgi:hypothetical protein